MADAESVSDGPRKPSQAKPYQSRPLLTRILYSVALRALQIFVLRPANQYRHWKSRRASPDTQPTIIKAYPSRPHLPIRIFFPSSYDRSQPSASLPLLFSIHGGGFVLGDPLDNDLWNRSFAQQHKALVVALNYSKAPASPFPEPVSDLENQIRAVFDDDELKPHIDPAKVGIKGFSAGGNLAVAVCEFQTVRDRITAGLVPIYPVLDLSIPHEVKAATRRYKPSLPGTRGSDRDVLFKMADVFNWAYIPPGQDTLDPLLSPIHADPAVLPLRVWVISCELDLLGHEGWRWACKLAGRRVPGLEEKIGQEALEASGQPGALITTGDERFAWEEKEGGREIRWLCVPDSPHGFDMAETMWADAQTVEDGRLKRDALIRMTGEWLYGK